MGGYTDPESLSYDPTLPRQPGICFSATTPGLTPVPQVLYSPLAELAMGCTNPLCNRTRMPQTSRKQLISTESIEVLGVSLLLGLCFNDSGEDNLEAGTDLN